MRLLLALGFVGWTLLCLGGVTRRLSPADARDRLTLVLTSGALGLGLLTLVAFWIMLIAPGAPALAAALAVSVAVWAASRVMDARSGRAPRAADAPHDRREPRGLLGWTLVAAIAGPIAAIVVDAAWWPFDNGDALALYAPFSAHLYRTASLPVGDRLHEGYPMLVPIAFAFMHWTAGGVNEYLARLIAALMGVGAILATAALGREVRHARAGLIAAAVLAVTPVFGRWATTGYTDVPAALYVGLTALFGWRWWQTADWRAAVLTGAAVGLACWTKNSALALLPGLAWLIAARSRIDRRGPTPRAAGVWASAALMGSAAAAVAAPWYVRNWLVFGFVVPPTMLTDRADHSLGALGAMLRPDAFFGVSGWLMTAAVPYAAAVIAGRGGTDRRRADAAHLLVALALPFLLAWWWLASYEVRFLTTILPLLAVLAALMIDDVVDWAPARLATAGVHVLRLGVVLLVAAAAAAAMRKTIEHKTAIAASVWLTDEERHRVRLGGLYDLARALNRLPPGSRVAGVPPVIRFHLDLDRLGLVDARVPEHAGQPGGYDYIVTHGAPGEPVGVGPPGRDLARVVLETADGYRLMRAVPATGGPGTTATGTR